MQETETGGIYLGQTNQHHQKHGKGTYINKLGHIYEGYFNQDSFIHGRFTYSDGAAMAEGQFKNWSAHG